LPYVTEELLEELDTQERLTLLSVARALKRESYTDFQSIRKAYISECEGASVEPLGKTRLRGNLKRLCDLGIVDVGREGSGRIGRLRFSIPDVPVEAIIDWAERVCVRAKI
jgi:Cdc6-like AAA superfamily ATPase